MKLIETRVRVESSHTRTEYFPEALYSSKNWLGKQICHWVGLSTDTVVISLENSQKETSYGLAVAKATIDREWTRYSAAGAEKLHEESKSIDYIKYPQGETL